MEMWAQILDAFGYTTGWACTTGDALCCACISYRDLSVV